MSSTGKKRGRKAGSKNVNSTKITMESFNNMAPEDRYYPGTTTSKFPLRKPKYFTGPSKGTKTKNPYYYFPDGSRNQAQFNADMNEYLEQKQKRSQRRNSRRSK